MDTTHATTAAPRRPRAAGVRRWRVAALATVAMAAAACADGEQPDAAATTAADEPAAGPTEVPGTGLEDHTRLLQRAAEAVDG